MNVVQIREPIEARNTTEGPNDCNFNKENFHRNDDADQNGACREMRKLFTFLRSFNDLQKAKIRFNNSF